MNGKYVKPMLFASKVSGEGVYLACGAGATPISIKLWKLSADI